MMMNIKKSLFVLTGFILFSCANKGNVQKTSSDGHGLKEVKETLAVVKGIDYDTEMKSLYIKYAGSKQMFLEPFTNYTSLEKDTQKDLSEKDSSFEYVSKIPDVSDSKNSEKAFIIHFDFNSAVIKKSEIKVLEELYKYISQNQNKVKKIILSGYTDEIGSESYNYTLAYNRALSVKRFLQTRLKSNKIEYILESKGKCCFVSNKNHDKNRRVEVEIQAY